jgi:formate dehydrogenase major subunit
MSEKITFTLDGREVSAAPGESIWDVAKREGTTIPHLCHSGEPGYRSDGNCRACMVEIEGERTLAASCIRTPSEGMVVSSQNDRSTKARKMVIEMLVADQPPRDKAHDRSSHFWDMAEAQHVSHSRFPAMEQQRVPLLDDSHVAMRVNLDACIHCNLCVRACREVQVNDVIGMAGRGHDAQIVFDFNDPMGASTCVACGECVQACPTGALTPATMVDAEQVGDSKAYDREVASVCPYCGVGCQLSFKIKDDKIAWVEGLDGPANENRLCVKGRFGFDYVAHPHRLTKPLIRREDAPPKGLNVDPANVLTHFREAKWEEALDLERGGVPLPEADPPGLPPQQRRPLHPPLPRLLGRRADGECRLRRRDRHLQRDRARGRRPRHRLQPDREPPRRRHLFQAVRQARRQADRHGPPRRRPRPLRHPPAEIPPRLRRRDAERDHARDRRGEAL